MSLSEEPAVRIRDLLEDNWDASNTSSITPKIHTGWFNNGWGDTPQVTITNPDENTFGGGDTGFIATEASGAGPVQAYVGTLMVVGWAHHEMNDQNPKSLVFEFSEEIKRIISNNLFDVQELEWVSFVGKERRVDVNADPTLFRQDCEVRYFYYRRP